MSDEIRDPGDRMYTLSQAAEFLGINMATLRRWMQTSGLEAKKDEIDKRARLLSGDDIRRLQQEHRRDSVGHLDIPPEVPSVNPSNAQSSLLSDLQGANVSQTQTAIESPTTPADPPQLKQHSLTAALTRVSQLQLTTADNLFATAARMSVAVQHQIELGNTTAALTMAERAAQLSEQAKEVSAAHEHTVELVAARRRQRNMSGWLKSHESPVRAACKGLRDVTRSLASIPADLQSECNGLYEQAVVSIDHLATSDPDAEPGPELESIRLFLTLVRSSARQYPELHRVWDQYAPMLGPLASM